MGTSLVVQRIRICLPVQGTRVRALVRENPTCRGATKPVRHNYWACALEHGSHNYWARVLQLLKPVHLEPVLHNKRSHRSEKPTLQRRVTPARRNQRKPVCSNEDPMQQKININKINKFKKKRNTISWYYYCYFTGETKKAQGYKVCPRANYWWAVKTGWNQSHLTLCHPMSSVTVTVFSFLCRPWSAGPQHQGLSPVGSPGAHGWTIQDVQLQQTLWNHTPTYLPFPFCSDPSRHPYTCP